MKGNEFQRYRWLGYFFTALIITIILQIVRIQTSAAKAFGDVNQQYAYEHRKIYPERGSIYDRWGHMLAGNVMMYEVAVDLRYVRNPETIASAAATILGLDYEKIYSQVSVKYEPGEQEYIVLENFASPDKIEKLESLNKKIQGPDGNQ